MAFRFLAPFLLACLLAHIARGQKEFVYNRLSVQDGLLSNNVLCVWQDEKGFLWIGTENGLQRHDGYAFRTILQRRIEQIITDNKNRVWVRSGNSIGLFNPSSFAFQEVAISAGSATLSGASLHLDRDASQRVYLIIKNIGCRYYSEVKKQFTPEANPFRLPDSLRIINIAEDSIKQRFWVQTFDGLGYYDLKTKEYYSWKNNPHADPLLAHPAMSGLIAHFYIDHAYKFWIQAWVKSDARFLCFDGRNNQFTTDTAGLASAGNGSYFDVYDFVEFNDSSFFVYGRNCLRIRDNNRFVNLRGPLYNPYTIQYNTVNQVMEDREKILWFATDNGLYNTTGNINRNLHIVLAEDPDKAAINALYEDEHGHLWLGTWGDGLIVVDPGSGQISEAGSLRKFTDGFTKLIWTISGNRIFHETWVGCQEGRLLVYHNETKQTRYYRPPAFRNSTIRQIVSDAMGTNWIGLQNGDVFKCASPANPGSDSAFRLLRNFGGHITRIQPDAKNRLWVAASNQGVYIINTATGTLLTKLDHANTAWNGIGNTRDLLHLNDSITLMAGDQLGIYNSAARTLEQITHYNGLPLGSLYTLQKDLNNDCWIGSSNGIYRFNLLTKQLTRYSQRDGLLTIHNSSYIPETSISLRNGYLAFAGNQHFVSFNPGYYKPKVQPPNVVITGFQLNNRYLPIDSLENLASIQLPYSGHSFTIEYAAMSFLQHEKLTYEYKLEGSNEEWSEQRSPQPVKYTLLPHGHYNFLVRVRDAEGNYSHSTTRLSIFVAPPFWKTYWFYICIALLLAGLLFYLHRLRLQRLLHVEKVRSRLARDLHDDMGSTLSTINILSNIALMQSPLEEKASKEYMSTINQSTTQMMESMDDIVWSINPVNDSFPKVLARMKEVAGTVLEPKNIEYNFDVAPAVRELNLSMEIRRDIFLIFKEALNNIVKYSQCSHVQFTLTRSHGHLLLEIADNGVGVRGVENGQTRGNGLKNMKKRAESMQGELKVGSAPGVGTRVSLKVPIA